VNTGELVAGVLIGLQAHAEMVLARLKHIEGMAYASLTMEEGNDRLVVHVGREIKSVLGPPDELAPFGLVGSKYTHQATWRPIPKVEIYCLLQADQVADMHRLLVHGESAQEEAPS